MKDSIDFAISVLNTALDADPVAINTLFSFRVPVNTQLSNHPSIRVRFNDTLGILGLINGLFGTMEDGWGHISALVELDGKIVRFERTQNLSTRSEFNCGS